MHDKLVVAAYCRVSTDKEDQINSLESQKSYFNDYITHHTGWELAEVYYDEGMSGTSTKKRLGFNRMVTDAENGKFHLILTKEVSRFARNTVDTLKFTRRLNEIGIGVIFTLDNIDTRFEDGELRLTLMSSIAQEESRKTSERVKWGQKRRMEQGVVFGRDMLGYAVKNGKLIVNPEEALTVQLIYHKFLNEGKGTHVIARELYEAGIQSKRSKEWSNSVVLRILRNEKYVGDLLQQKTYTPNFLSHAKKYNRGNREVVYIKNHHERIIDRGMWDNVQNELMLRSGRFSEKTKYSNRYWCSGKIICGECGGRFVSRTKRQKNGLYKAWRCNNYAKYGKEKNDRFGHRIGCKSHAVNDKVLLSCISHVLKNIPINRNRIISELVQDIQVLSPAEGNIDTNKLIKEIEQIKDKKKKAIRLMLENIISKEDLKLTLDGYNAEVKSLLEQVEEAKNKKRYQSEKIEKYIDELRKILDFESEQEKICEEMTDKIIVFSNKVVQVYLKNIPFLIKLHYSKSGRSGGFRVRIDKMEIV
ncbi:MAG: recombinase family protein [Clostridiales bacterium]|nr:recombinase family protein [Clostridiales bacterium]